MLLEKTVLFERIKAELINKGPALIRLPLRVVPFSLKRRVIEQLLKWQFAQALADEELDFLADRWLKIEITDIELTWFVTLDNNQLKVSDQADADVIFSANSYDLILIAARKEDPDTLFFQRRLLIEGDTELGLYVKNLMDAIELELMPAPLRVGLMQIAELVESSLKAQTRHKKPDSYKGQVSHHAN